MVWEGGASRSGYGVCRAGHGCGCVPVLVLVLTSWRGRPVVAAGSWAWVPWGMVAGRLLRSVFPVCVSPFGPLVVLGFQGTGQGVLAVGGQW